MKKKKTLLLLSFVFVGFVVNAQHPSTDPNWEIVIQDYFTEPSLNTNIWWIKNKESHGNGEAEEPQIYMSENVYINNGQLVLMTDCKHTNDTLICQLHSNCHYFEGGHQYTSGAIMSIDTFKYGYFEIKAKLPTGQGYWPAFWLWNATPDSQTSNCWYNEIDIFEGYGCLVDSVTCTIHWNFNCPADCANDSLDTIPAVNYSQISHWYGLEWNENEITWYIDRQKVRSIPNNVGDIGIQNYMYIIINSALLPPRKQCGIDSNIVLPNYMYIDTVNVYQLICDKNTIVNEIDYDSYIYGVKKSITISEIFHWTSGQNIFLKATDFIELKDGFVVPNNAQLYLHTTPCE